MKFDIFTFGIALVALGFIILFVGALYPLLNAADIKQEKGIRFSFFSFIGPFPFGFGNGKRLFALALAIGALLALILIFSSKGKLI